MKEQYEVAKSQLEQVRDSTDIVELISEYLPLKKAGVNFKGLCPFHKEKTPSFVVSHSKQIYHCFGCGEGGNVFDFIMKVQGLTFREALEKLATKAGIELKPFRGQEVKGRDREKERLFGLNKAAAEYFRASLKDERLGGKASKYLEGRGLDRKAQEKFFLGFAPAAWDGLKGFLAQRKIDLKEAEIAGLIIAKKGGRDYYDRFRGRVIFPISDIEGRIIGFGGRTLEGDEAKYINSPESPVFSKRHSFYGLGKNAVRAMKEKGYAIIVEGYMDLLALKMNGFDNSVATLGTAFTADHGKMLKRFTDSVYITFDSDEAGLAAVKRTIRPALLSSLNAKVIVLPKPHDPDTFLKEKGSQEFESLIDGASGLVDFYVKNYFEEEVGLVGKAQVLEELKEVLNDVPSQFERELLIKKVSELTGIKNALFNEESSRKKRFKEPEKKSGALPREELLLMRLMLEDVRLIDSARDEGVAQKLSVNEIREIVTKIIQDKEAGQKAKVNDYIGEITDPLIKRTLFELLLEKDSFSSDELRKAFSNCVERIKKNYLKKQSTELQRQLIAAEKAGDEERCRELLEMKKSLVKGRSPIP